MLVVVMVGLAPGWLVKAVMVVLLASGAAQLHLGLVARAVERALLDSRAEWLAQRARQDKERVVDPAWVRWLDTRELEALRVMAEQMQESGSNHILSE